MELGGMFSNDVATLGGTPDKSGMTYRGNLIPLTSLQTLGIPIPIILKGRRQRRGVSRHYILFYPY